MQQVLSPKRFAVTLATSLLLFLHFSSSHPTSSSGGYTAAPGDATCLNCHSTGSINGNIEISGIPSTVDGGTTYPITVTINNTVGTAARAGFQMVTLKTSAIANSGTYTVPTGVTNVEVKPGGSKSYIGHKGAQTFDGNPSITYDVEWTAPTDQDGQEIKFYAAALLGNGSDGNSQDRFVTTNFTATISGGSATPFTTTTSDITAVSCEDGNDGSATVTAMGGFGTYTYDWDNGETDAIATMLAPGIHEVTVSDGISTKIESVTIANANSIFFEVDTTDPLCFGENSGTATANASGGAEGFEYDWSTGDVGATISNLAAGTYEVTATDDNECEKVLSVTINDQDEVQLVVDFTTEISCNGESDGVIEIGIVSNTSIIDYNWTPNIGIQNDNEISGIPPGTYTLVVTDENGCTNSISHTLSNPVLLTVDIIDVVNGSCEGANNGRATAVASGGTGTVTYEWSNGNTDETNNNLAPGIYSVTVTDANNCSSNMEIEIFDGPELTFEIIIFDFPSCGNENGLVEIAPDPFLTDVTYLWSDGQTTQLASNLAPGSITVTVSVADGLCFKDTTFSLPETNTLEAYLFDSSHVTCTNGSDGTATIQVSGGTAPYDIIWPDSLETAYRDDLTAGTYTVTVVDTVGCTELVIFDINEPEALSLVSETIISPGCSTSSPMGSISIEIEGGTGPYRFQWSTGGDSTQIEDLIPGSYSCTIFDDNGCFYFYQGTVLDTLSFEVMATPEMICFGDSTGIANLEIIRGNASFSVVWGDGLSTDSLYRDDLPFGNTTYEVTDAFGCSVFDSINIDEPTLLLTGATSTDETVPNSNNGTATVAPSGGIPPYSVLWSTGDSTNTLVDLMPGTYTVQVTDFIGCVVFDTIDVEAFSCLMTLSLESQDVTCFNQADGFVSVSASNGNSPYSYLWSTGDTTDMIDGLSPGVYEITVTDSVGCMLSLTDTIVQPDSMYLIHTITNPSSTAMTGNIELTVVGGTSPYEVLWSTGDSTLVIDSLEIGTYSVTVIDEIGCIVEASYDIELVECQDSITFSEVTEVVCFGKNDGSTTANLASGDTTATYIWSTGDSTSTINDLIAGQYFIEINLSNGCSYLDSITLEQNPEITISDLAITNESTAGANDGSITVNASGGVSDVYTFQWFDESNTVISTEKDLRNVTTGEYYLCITDANNCNGLFGPFAISVSTSVEDEDLANIKVFPIPTTNKVFVNHIGLTVYKVQLLDMNGKVVTTKYETVKDQTEVDLKDIPNGNYVLKLETDRSIISKMVSIVK